jgi:hypothetical protein
VPSFDISCHAATADQPVPPDTRREYLKTLKRAIEAASVDELLLALRATGIADTVEQFRNALARPSRTEMNTPREPV